MFFTDQLHRKIELKSPPKRIVSLVPSQTELLYDLGLHDEVVGITKFCIHPNEWFRNKTRVGGTKQLKLDIIKQLQPDLIIGNKEENEKEQVEQLIKEYPVWMSEIYTLKDAFDMITSIGTVVGKQQESILLKLQIESGFNQLKNDLLPFTNSLKVIYLIWKEPYMAAGNNTFINTILECCGFQNCLHENDLSRYPELNLEEITSLKPDLILLSSEPYPFKEKHIEELKQMCPQTKVMLVDGEAFSWYGSRLLHTPAYLKQLLAKIKE